MTVSLLAVIILDVDSVDTQGCQPTSSRAGPQMKDSNLGRNGCVLKQVNILARLVIRSLTLVKDVYKDFWHRTNLQLGNNQYTSQYPLKMLFLNYSNQQCLPR